MKNLRNIFALFILATALFSCDADVSIDDPKGDNLETISADNDGNGNSTEERDS